MPTKIEKTTRRHDLDWLRVIAFGVLIYFHAAVAFVDNPLPLTVNAQLSPMMGQAVFFFAQFRLGLLFFVSGCGVFYALRRRNRSAFFKERSARLLIPLTFGITVLVPIMVYLEKLYIGSISAGGIEFYLGYFTGGIYPSGTLSWHHFWFIAYLYIFSLLGWMLFSRLEEQRAWTWLTRLLEHSRDRIWPIYVVLVPLVIIELVLRPLFPGFRDLIHDWASFSQWFIVFVCGYIFASKPHLLERAAELRGRNLGAAILCSALLLMCFWNAEQFKIEIFVEGQSDVVRFIVFSVFRGINPWLWLLVCVGFAAQYLNRPSKTITYLNQAVYPFFCLHLTVLVIFEYWILPMTLSVASKYWIITTLTVVTLLIAYELLKRISYVRPLVGLKN